MTRILVVDDDEGLREVIRQALEASGFAVMEAEDGSAGVQLASAYLPDLILCDVRMERMDGYRALAALRQNPATASLPFILMTGQADTAGMRHGMELGADDYLAKPFTISQLLASVDARLKKQQAIQAKAERQLADLRANISLALPHELLTPLNGILGFSDILISDHASLESTEIVSMSEAIRDSAERLHRLIENFLVFVQLELLRADQNLMGRDTPRLALGPVIRAVCERRAQQTGRTADLNFELAEASASIAEDHFSKMVFELLDNALKFSPPGAPVRISLAQQDHSCVLRVTDQGRGMKPEHIAQVGAYMQFERRFYEQQGSGLGLTITRRLAELYGGGVAITSEVGSGTTIEVRLPAGGTAASAGSPT